MKCLVEPSNRSWELVVCLKIACKEVLEVLGAFLSSFSVSIGRSLGALGLNCLESCFFYFVFLVGNLTNVF